MSQENVDLVRDMCEAFVAGDIAKAMDGLAADVVWHGTIGGLDEGQTYHGHEEVIGGFVESMQAWETHSLEAQRFIDAGDGVVVFWHESGRGKGSGAEVTTDTGVIYTVKGGKVAEVQGYMDRERALEAAGVSDA